MGWTWPKAILAMVLVILAWWIWAVLLDSWWVGLLMAVGLPAGAIGLCAVALVGIDMLEGD